MIEEKIEDWHVIFAGFRGVELPGMDAFLESIRRETSDSQVQVFDAEMIAGFDHLYFSVLNALKAFGSGHRISDSPAMEILLYASGQHQIEKAIRLIGVKPNSHQIVVVAISRSKEAALKAMIKISGMIGGEPCDGVMELTEEKFQRIKMAFKVSDAELEATLRETKMKALTSILVERSALLVTQV